MNKTQQRKALQLMIQSRTFEELTEQFFKEGLIHGTTHLANGQEASQVGLCLALKHNDWIVPTHRCHGYTLCKGSDPAKMFAEMFGSKKGLAKGLGGSMHMPDKIHCNLGSSAVVGSGVPLATGIAFYLKRHNQNNISVAIFGDGASSRGSVHESMNLASVWNLPVLFFCENNHYGMSAPIEKTVSIHRISDRAQAYGMAGKSVDGNDVEQVFQAVSEARKYILENSKPYLLEVDTYRQKGHSKSDKCVYRSREEEAFWLEKDPIENFRKKLLREKVLDRKTIALIEKQAKEKIKLCAEKAISGSEKTISEKEAKALVFCTGEQQ